MNWTTETPISDPQSWLLFLVGFAPVVLLPGALLLRTQLHRLGPVWFLGFSYAVGMLIAPVYAALARLLSLPYELYGHMAFCLVSTFWLGGADHFQPFLRQLSEPFVVRRRGEWLYELAVVASCLAVAVLLIRSFGELVAPPHVHDASNHAFLVRRIVEVRGTSMDQIFGGDVGTPVTSYLVGWHAAAALISRATPLAPYLAMWHLAVAAGILLPLCYSLLWRQWGISRLGTAFAAVVVCSLGELPFSTYRWGGLGMIVGASLAPVAGVFIARGIRAWRSATLVVALCSIIALIHIHAQGAVTAVLIAVAFWGSAPGSSVASPHRWRPLLVALVVAGALAGFDLFEIASDYQSTRMVPQANGAESLAETFRSLGGRFGRNSFMVFLALGGFVAILWRRRTRAVGMVAGALIALYMMLMRSQDPVTLALGVPFYQMAARVVMTLLPFVVPMFFQLPVLLLERLTRPLHRAPILVLTIWALVVSFTNGRERSSQYLAHDRLQSLVPFGPDEYVMALEIGERLEEDAVVLNAWNDGSTWAMHVSGRRFLLPCSWRLKGPGELDFRKLLSELYLRPWGQQVETLRESGVNYLYMSDVALTNSHTRLRLTRAALEGDPRFCEQLRTETSSLYRIDWKANDQLESEVQYEEGFSAPTSFGRWADEEICRIVVRPDARAEKLVFTVAGFQGQIGSQEFELWLGDEKVESFEFGRHVWWWETLSVPLPAYEAGRTLGYEIRFSKRWTERRGGGALRALPFRDVSTVRSDPSPCGPEIIRATGGAASGEHADGARSP